MSVSISDKARSKCVKELHDVMTKLNASELNHVTELLLPSPCDVRLVHLYTGVLDMNLAHVCANRTPTKRVRKIET